MNNEAQQEKEKIVSDGDEQKTLKLFLCIT